MSKLRKVTARYAQVAWSVVQADMSFAAKGIYADLMSRPDDWKISIEALTKHGPDGRQAVTTAVNELIEHGVYHRIRVRRGGVFHTYVILTAEPCTEAEAIAGADLPDGPVETEPLQLDIPGHAHEPAGNSGNVPTPGNLTVGNLGSRVPDSQVTVESSTSEEMNRRDVQKNTSSPPPDPSFAEFWKVYPRKIGKGDAKKAWTTATRRGASTKNIIDAAARYAAETARQRTEARFIKHPSSWLNAERYADEPDQAPPAEYTGWASGD